MPSSRPPDEKLTEFGHLYYLYCDELGMTGKEMELGAGFKSGTLSRNTRLPESGPGISKHPRRETVIQLSVTMKRIAAEKGILWGDERERYLLHSAYHATTPDVAEAEAYYQERRAAFEQEGKTPPNLS
jgi:hypothetical protein